MPRKQKIDEIDKGALQAARERFKKRPGRVKSIFPFEWWLDVFKKRRNSFQEIAYSVGCTRENVRQLYRRIFSPLFPDFPNGRSRQKFSTLERYSEQQTIGARDFSVAPEILRVVAEIAHERGLEVERIPVLVKGEKISFSSRSLLINGGKCDIHKVTTIRKQPLGKRMHCNCSFSVRHLRKHDFFILLQEAKNYPRRVFVIPAPILLRGWGKKGKRAYFYIPIRKYPVYRNHRSRKPDIWQYLDAWHLLKIIGNP